MSKTIAIRVSDEVHSALTAQCLASGQTMTELVLPTILGLIDLPPALTVSIEVRVMALETQMLVVADRLMAIEGSGKSDVRAIAMEPTSIDPQPIEISAEPESIEDKRSLVSDRDSGRGGTSTSEFDRYAVPILKPITSGGYYFRFDDIGQPELKATIQNQAKLMGFKSDSIKIDRKPTRVWLNREYCLQPANT